MSGAFRIVSIRHGASSAIHHTTYSADLSERFAAKLFGISNAKGPAAAKRRLLIHEMMRLRLPFFPVPDRYTGMTSNGSDQIGRLFAALDEAEIKPDIIAASPYRRARQAAMLAADFYGIPKDAVLITEGFRERSLGKMYGWPAKYWPCLHPRQKEVDRNINIIPPGGESIAAVRKRVMSDMSPYLDPEMAGTLFIVCHGKVMVCIHDILMQLGLQECNNRLKSVTTSSAIVYDRRTDDSWTANFDFIKKA